MTSSGRRSWARPAGLVLVASVSMTGCGGGEPPADRLGEAVVAVYATSVYGFDNDLHGRVILADAEGTARAMETEGIYLGSLSYDGSRLYASDAEQELVVDSDGSRRIARTTTHDMEWWSGIVGSRRWTLFNDGTQGTADYHTGVSSTDGRSLVEGDVVGDVLGQTSCGDELVLAVGRWDAPRDSRGTVLARVGVQDGRVLVDRGAAAALPRGARVVNLACDGDDPLVLALQRGTLLLGREEVAGHRIADWTPVPATGVPVTGEEVVLGTVGRELFLWAPYQGVRALDLGSLRTRQVVDTGMDGTGTVGLRGGHLVAWEPAVPAVRWYDAASGKVVREVPGDHIAELLESHGEMVEQPPVSLG